MSKKKKSEFDYREHAQKKGPDQRSVRRGVKRHVQMSGLAKQRITIRIDEEILEEFRQLVPKGRGYQSLINQALSEWLTARGVRELVREEIRDVIEEAVAKAAG